MAVHRLYETTKKLDDRRDGNEGFRLTRFYYDDISDEVMARVFKISGDRGQKPAFVGEHRTPLVETPDEIRRRAEQFKIDPLRNVRDARARITEKLETVEECVPEKPDAAVSTIEDMTHAVRDSAHYIAGEDDRRIVPRRSERVSVPSYHKTGQMPWLLIGGIFLIGYALARHHRRDSDPLSHPDARM